MADADEQDKPQGPVDPHGPGGIDAPAPPGGPQRTDTPSGGSTPGEAAPDPGPEPKPASGDAGDDERADKPDLSGHGQGEQATKVQEENAETSLDQPSQ